MSTMAPVPVAQMPLSSPDDLVPCGPFRGRAGRTVQPPIWPLAGPASQRWPRPPETAERGRADDHTTTQAARQAERKLDAK